jgi:hypothetical protein
MRFTLPARDADVAEPVDAGDLKAYNILDFSQISAIFSGN